MTEFPLDDPFVWLGEWLSEAEATGVPDHNAMSLATASVEGVPSVRTILLKGFDRSGLVFFTNLGSRKSRELIENPHAALLFFWRSLGRQIRIRGTVDVVESDEADAYFATRHPRSKLGAWASHQSDPLESREVLMARVDEMGALFADTDTPRPPHWSGFRLSPVAFEFWVSQDNRLHDRWEWTQVDGAWASQRLFP